MIKKAVILWGALGSLIISSHMANANEIKSFMACKKIVENEKRLACFDTAAEEIFQSGGMTSVIEHKKLTQKDQVANFAKSQLRTSPVKLVREEEKKIKKEDLTEIKLKVIKVVFSTTKKFILFMENGQIWKQKESGRFHFPKNDFDVTIKKSFIGGYNMIVPYHRSLVKVKRLK